MKRNCEYPRYCGSCYEPIKFYQIWLPSPELLILISLLYVIYYHKVILVSWQCWSLAAKCGHCSWLLTLQVTISHINCEWIRPILLKYKLCDYFNTVLDLGLNNVLRNLFTGWGGVVVTPLAEPPSYVQAVFAAIITVQAVVSSTPTPTSKDNWFFGHF